MNSFEFSFKTHFLFGHICNNICGSKISFFCAKTKTKQMGSSITWHIYIVCYYSNLLKEIIQSPQKVFGYLKKTLKNNWHYVTNYQTSILKYIFFKTIIKPEMFKCDLSVQIFFWGQCTVCPIWAWVCFNCQCKTLTTGSKSRFSVGFAAIYTDSVISAWF